MSPRPGGEADKIGNRYEGAWTVGQLLNVLAGQVEWVRIEPLGEIGRGVEFMQRRADGTVEVHQVKRQSGNANGWSLDALASLGIWESARRHAEAGRDYHFVSLVPFRALQELSERVRNSKDFSSFIHAGLPKTLSELFTRVGNLYGESECAYRVLCHFYVRLIDETEFGHRNEVLAELLLEGCTGRQARAVLGELVDDNFDTELTDERILELLGPYKIYRRLAVSRQGLKDHVRAETVAWLTRVGQQLLEPIIPREEAEQLYNLKLAPERVHFLVGPAGGGKTAILHQLVRDLVSDDVPTLVMRLDRYGPLTSTNDLGRKAELDVSPVTALAGASDGRPAFLIVDQLDAVSLASGRLPDNFDVVADLVAEASTIPNLHVILSCRQFDVDNDYRIRTLKDRLKATTHSVAPLLDEQVENVVSEHGLPAAALDVHQREILRLPLHLVLWATVARESDALSFVNSQRLFDVYWERKRQAALRRRDGVRFGKVVNRLAQVISERQQLSVPISVLDDEDLAEDADVLVSEQLLVRDKAEIAFFHEAVFDYAFARQWTNQRQSLVDFLKEGEQELFRRGQVRQIMVHLRALEPERFIGEVRELLVNENVRFHIKDAALSVLGALDDPSTVEANMLIEVGDSQPGLQSRLWFHLGTAAWFSRLDADGRWADWLGGDEEHRERALGHIINMAGAFPDRIVDLLAGHRDEPSYPMWMRKIVLSAGGGASRRLFELLLHSIRAGHYDGFEHDLWVSVHDLADEHAEWGVEVLETFLTDRPSAMELNQRGQIRALRICDYSVARLVRKVAAASPRKFYDSILPYLLQVMELTAYKGDEQRPRRDPHFSIRYPEVESKNDLDDVLYAESAATIRQLVATEPIEMRSALEPLARDPHYGAQWLLYQGLIEGGATYAEWAAQLLLEGKHRYQCGYSSNGVWTTRQVLEVIGPHVSSELFGRLESEIRDLRFPWERRSRGWYAFNLLSALDAKRLSQVGARRLGEYRRAFAVEEPPVPEGVVGGWIGSPIPMEAAQHMSDDNWLEAMAKHAEEREVFTLWKGGARELSQVLREQAKQDPDRFARLALRLTPDTNSAYGDAMLMGLGDAGQLTDQTLVFDAVRHIASFGHSENDRWLGSALRPYFKTASLDIVELVRDRLLVTSDPSDEGMRVWSNSESGVSVPDIQSSGINTARGSLAEALGDLLIYDADGARTALVEPILSQLAEDPSIPVRTCVAHLIGAAMRHARPAATEAFWRLIEADDILLGAQAVTRLLVFLGHEEPSAVQPIVERMLASQDTQVQEAGGQLAAYAAMEWSIAEHLEVVLDGGSIAARKGAASMAAHGLPRTANAEVASAALVALANDSDGAVRKETISVIGVLRDHPLRPYEQVIKALIASPAFNDALSQLTITLEHAPDQVDDLALVCAQRFVEVFGAEAGEAWTRAAADAREIGQLVVRGLAQSRTSDGRSDLLDVLDQLLLIGAYGIDEMILSSER